MRFAWPNSSPKEAVIIDCPEAAQFVSVFDPNAVTTENKNKQRPGKSAYRGAQHKPLE